MRMRSRRAKQKGFIVSTELVLIATLLVVGLTAGLQSVRVAVVTEMADLAEAIGSLDQSYSYGGASRVDAATPGGAFVDTPDPVVTSGIRFGQGL